MSAKAQTKTGALLVEARTEELPPQLLGGLANQFPDSLLTNLQKAGFADAESSREKDAEGRLKLLATPRRIAALLKNIRRAAPDRMLTRRGPQVAAALDKDGKPTKALEGFLRATNSRIGDLRKVTEKGKEYFAADLREEGGTLGGKLAAIVQETLLSLNAPRLMRWGDNDWRFIRPLRGMVMLWETEEIAGEVMGVKAGRTTQGHRFLSDGAVEIESAEKYESAMEKAQVIADYRVRFKKIWGALLEAAKENGGQLGEWPDFSPENGELVEDIAAICEFPHVYCGNIRPEFMNIPDFCFDLCLRKHQWCFPLEKHGGGRIPQFLFVADNAPKNSAEMLQGFERVLSARLSDVAFYLAEDRKVSLDDNREKLKRITYHEKLGSQFDRAERVYGLTGTFAGIMGLKPRERQDAVKAAYVFLADLPTLIVGEYPELQGCVAAEYYANSDVKRILTEVNTEEMREGSFPDTDCLLLAIHMEKIAGMFAVGEKSTGDKDPHGLRTSASRVADLLMECDVDLNALITTSLSIFFRTMESHSDEMYDFIVERSRRHFGLPPKYVVTDDFYRNRDMDNFHENIVEFEAPTKSDLKVEKLTVDAVLSQRPSRLFGLKAKVQALQEFAYDSRARTLIAANKRINNIFRKSKVTLESLPPVSDTLFEHEEERALFRTVRALGGESAALIKTAEETNSLERYGEALRIISTAAAPVDAFFDKVMVNADDEKIRANRFALLAELRALLNQVADISKLAG